MRGGMPRLISNALPTQPHNALYLNALQNRPFHTAKWAIMQR